MKNNKERIALYKRQYYQEKRDYITAYKLQHPCEHCGEEDPVVLDFHHIDPNAKDATVANMLSKAPIIRLIEEISKCIVLCANCHRRLHHNQKQE